MAAEEQLARLEAALDGDVVVPEAAAYDEVRKSPWAQYAQVRPLAVARCRTPADVAATIAFARRERLPLAIRSGGHCFAGRSTTRGLVLDLSPIASVCGPGDVAHVGAGALLGDIDDTLVPQRRALVAGACPSVGVAGLTLGADWASSAAASASPATGFSRRRSYLPTAALSRATKNVTRTCSGLSAAPAQAASASSPASPSARSRRSGSPASSSRGPPRTRPESSTLGNGLPPLRPTSSPRACS